MPEIHGRPGRPRLAIWSMLAVLIWTLAASCSSRPSDQQLEAAGERVDTFTRFAMESNWEGAHNNLEASYRNNCSTTAFARQLQEAMGERPASFSWEELRADGDWSATVAGVASTYSGSRIPLSLELAYLDDMYVWQVTDLSVDGQRICRADRSPDRTGSEHPSRPRQPERRQPT